MVLGWTNGENTVISGILDRMATLENKIKLLESENATQKAEIAILKNNMNTSKNFNDKACPEWRDKLVGKKNKITENQITILNAVGSEQKDRQNRESNVILFGVPESTATSGAEREKEDKATTMEILKEIGGFDTVVSNIKRFKANPNTTGAIKKPLPIRVTFDDRDNVQLSLIEAKSLKDSVKFKSVFFSKDLTPVQIFQLKQLIKTRNEENARLDAAHKAANTKAKYRYGIRNDRVVKVYLNQD
jgi:hypothetical protein